MRILTSICFILLIAVNANAQLDTIHFETLPSEEPFSIHYVSQINHDAQGNLWVCASSGLYRYNGYSVNQFKEGINGKYGLVRNEIRRSHVDTDGKIWFAGAFSIYRYDQVIGQLERMTDSLRTHYKHLYSIAYFDIDDYKDQMIFASKRGIQFYSKTLGRVTDFDILVPEINEDSYSSNAHVFQIEKDPVHSNKRWLLTKAGLIHYDLEKRSSEIIKTPKGIRFDNIRGLGNAMCILDNNIYVLLNHLKVYKYNVKLDKWSEVPQGKNLTKSIHLRNIKVINDGILMIYISNGLHFYNPENNTTSVIPTVNVHSEQRHSISRMGIDHTGALTYVNGNRKLVKSGQSIYPVRFTNKDVFYEKFKINDQSSDTINVYQSIDLKQHERKISFSMGLTNRNQNESEKYYYKTNVDDDWIQLESRHIELDNLHPNVKEIYTKIETNGQIYEGKSLRIKSSKYFYETRLFWLLLAGFLTLVFGIILYLYFKRKQEKKNFEQQLLALEMDRLRSQMNPHFLFNSMNSIKNYLVSRTKEEAADYITDFSKLIRLILENSRKKFLSLTEEVEMLKLYVAMENKRLNGTIEFHCEVDSNISNGFILAPMLIQPYVENAIWHGLMHKKENRKLRLSFKSVNEGVQCIIHDNGVGREYMAKKQAGVRLSKKSLGTRITGDRITMINKMFDLENETNIEDLYDENGEAIGTEVSIFLPPIEAKNK